MEAVSSKKALGQTESNPVKISEVKFRSNGLTLAGNLYYPAEKDPAEDLFAGIVVSHPGTGVKEQTAGLYARRLAERGFVALAFDAAYQGESEGMPRNLEDPAQRIEDIKSAVSFLTTAEGVGAARIGVLGICASGGYALAAAAVDTRIKAVATVSAVDVGRQFRNGADGHQSPMVFQGMLDAAAADRNNEAKGEAPGVFPVFPADEQQARALGQHAFEGWEYYCSNRGQHPRSAKYLTWNSVDRIASFDAFRFIDRIAPRPLLLIAGTEAVTMWMTEEAYEKARVPKEIFLIEGATHVDLYDKDVYVRPVVVKLEAFFGSL